MVCPLVAELRAILLSPSRQPESHPQGLADGYPAAGFLLVAANVAGAHTGVEPMGEDEREPDEEEDENKLR